MNLSNLTIQAAQVLDKKSGGLEIFIFLSCSYYEEVLASKMNLKALYENIFPSYLLNLLKLTCFVGKHFVKTDF